MNFIEYIKNTVSTFGKETQKIGLTQFKTPAAQDIQPTPSLKNKDIKLSDLMRRMN